MRISLHQYYMKIAQLTSIRSTSIHRKVGALLVGNGGIISTGYNGSPRGEPHENETGCMREKLKEEGKIKSGEMFELCSEVHAEINAIVQAAISGTSISGATLYTTQSPCKMCARVIINAKISQVVYLDIYDMEGLDILAGKLKIFTIQME